MNSRLICLVLASLILLLIAGCSAPDEPGIIQWPMQKQCNLHEGPCTARQGDQAVTLEITPHPIPVAKPLQVTVRLTHIPAKAVALDMTGLNMYMGFNRTHLRPIKPDIWTGQSIIAFCTNRVMQWQVSVLITRPDGQIIQVPFYLETYRPEPGTALSTPVIRTLQPERESSSFHQH